MNMTFKFGLSSVAFCESSIPSMPGITISVRSRLYEDLFSLSLSNASMPSFVDVTAWPAFSSAAVRKLHIDLSSSANNILAITFSLISFFYRYKPTFTSLKNSDSVWISYVALFRMASSNCLPTFSHIYVDLTKSERSSGVPYLRASFAASPRLPSVSAPSFLFVMISLGPVTL